MLFYNRFKYLQQALLFVITFIFIVDTAFAQPADRKATKQTVNLYHHLNSLLQKGTMFGHEDDLAYGLTWKYEEGRSDVKDVTGAYPAVFGWDISGWEKDAGVNIDTVPFVKIKQYIRQVYDMGGINTISWHMDNPLSGKKAWDTTQNTVAAILPGGQQHELYKSWLDKAAGLFKNLKGSNGKVIPILFRPFHELTGNWFWWGTRTCTPQEYKQLWQFTFNYLSHKKKVHNLLYVYSTSDVASNEEFLERYPGDAFADIVGFDYYDRTDAAKKQVFIKQFENNLTIVERFAARHHKIPTVAETGHEAIPYATWWTDVLNKMLSKHKASYVLLWRNAGWLPSKNKYHYFVPDKGHASAADFIRFYQQDNIIFGDKLKEEHIYQ